MKLALLDIPFASIFGQLLMNDIIRRFIILQLRWNCHKHLCQLVIITSLFSFIALRWGPQIKILFSKKALLLLLGYLIIILLLSKRTSNIDSVSVNFLSDRRWNRFFLIGRPCWRWFIMAISDVTLLVFQSW